MARRDHGFTLIEILLVVAFIGLIVLAVVNLPSGVTKWYKRGQSRQQANTEARICMETIERTMSNGRASTLLISPSATTPVMQFAQAQFNTTDGSSYTITWSTAPLNSVHIFRTPPGGGTATDTILATHVTGLGFTNDPVNDPALVNVMIRMTVPLDSSGTPDSYLTILLSNQTIRMIAN